MARTKQIDFRRVTFSFPAEVLQDLRRKVGINNMSGYVTSLVEKDLKKKMKEEESDSFFQSLDDLAKLSEAAAKDPRSSLEILREIRYGGKY